MKKLLLTSASKPEKSSRRRQPALTIRREQLLVCRTRRCRPETPTPEPGSALLEESPNPSLWPRSAGLNKARTATDGGDEQMFGAE
jgi:hypothetical protein